MGQYFPPDGDGRDLGNYPDGVGWHFPGAAGCLSSRVFSRAQYFAPSGRLSRRAPVAKFGANNTDLALGLLFVAAVGLGAFAGTIALAIHTATVLGKLLSESVENIDEGVVEAIRATGAGYSQILSFAVVPQILPDLISFTLYRLETNIRAASVLGLIGAGGIGYLMNTSFRTFHYQEAAAIVLVLIALVMLVDYCSSRLRRLVV